MHHAVKILHISVYRMYLRQEKKKNPPAFLRLKTYKRGLARWLTHYAPSLTDILLSYMLSKSQLLY